MIGFKGRLGFIQYMPKKPTKWGLKAFVLADAHTGYMYSWHLYTGKIHHMHDYDYIHLVRYKVHNTSCIYMYF